MNIISLFILLIIIFLGIGIFVKWNEIKIYYWKKNFSNSKEEKEIEKILEKNVIFYKHLNEKYKNKLKMDTYIMSKLKMIEGIEIKITEEIKYTIFGLSGLLLLGNENTEYYPNLTSVVVYPRAYISDQNGKEKTVNLGEYSSNNTLQNSKVALFFRSSNDTSPVIFIKESLTYTKLSLIE